jgi:uncharacterized protein (DUF1810 family)
VPDPFDLQRFVDAQESIYEQVCRELRGGRKTSHWMWFVFPQIEGLGYSPMARRYAISGRAEAAAYAEHDVLGTRLRECAAIVNALEGLMVRAIFGSPDDLKFRSSMTLFAACAADNHVFLDALAKYFGGDGDPLTMAQLQPAGPAGS